MTDHVPVAIVGAGPVGVAAALLLARRGVRSVVLERHPAPYPLPRAVHLDDEAVRILQAAGVADEFARISRPAPGMRLLDGRMRTMAEFARPTDRVGHNGWPSANMFDQPDLERLLLTAAERDPLVDIRRCCEVTGVDSTVAPGADSTVASVHYDRDGAAHELTADWVIGCDGANSMVREAIGGAFRDLGFQERWLVIDIRSSAPLDVWGGVHQICDPTRAATFMHVVGNRYRWEFRMTNDEASADLLKDLEEMVSPQTRGIPFELVRHAEYTFRARVADRWRRDRLLIAGDASHQTPPFIGQGLGAGLRDAANLTWKIVAFLDGGADLLDTYELERRPHVTRVIRGATLVGWALTGGQSRAATARRLLVGSLSRVPALAATAADNSSPRLPCGPLVAWRPTGGADGGGSPGTSGPRASAGGRARRGGNRLAGTLCPQPHAGFDDRLGLGWCVVSRGPVRSVLPVLYASAADDSARAALARWLDQGHAYAALVRPDRVVAATAGSPHEVAALADLAANAISRRIVRGADGDA
jgi:3-(3-hydroxy-phenyl)propionate hydroxylase